MAGFNRRRANRSHGIPQSLQESDEIVLFLIRELQIAAVVSC